MVTTNSFNPLAAVELGFNKQDKNISASRKTRSVIKYQLLKLVTKMMSKCKKRTQINQTNDLIFLRLA